VNSHPRRDTIWANAWSACRSGCLACPVSRTGRQGRGPSCKSSGSRCAGTWMKGCAIPR
jgi:hypothetical protein